VLRNATYGLKGAVVVMTDNTTNATISANTSALGYFMFTNVQTGRTYTVSVSSKQFNYASQQVTVNGDLGDINFTPAP
jgi:hypothetical protein